MKFSIITITYNSRPHLEETINSIISQDYPDLEYIIVDGGSIDGTLDIIRDYATKDRRIRWTSEPDNGIADAFNKGIVLSTGEIIGILNSDDAYCQGALRIVADAYLSNPECDVFHGDIVKFEGDSPLFLLKPSKVGSNIWCEMPINHPATFITKRAYDKVGIFDPNLKIAMDYDLVLRLYLNGCRFHYIDKVLVNMRYGGASDYRFIEGLKESFNITVKQGYPCFKAMFWFFYKLVMSSIKNIFRRTGLYSLVRLHPRFYPPR